MATNALLPALLESPNWDLIGPTVEDDIRRAVFRYGAEAVKKAVKDATKVKLGRKREPDMRELAGVIEDDARYWLAGNDPFKRRSNYAMAKAFSEANPGQSIISTHKRIERKLSKGRFNRRWYTLTLAENLSRDDFPYADHLRALEAVANLPGASHWDQKALERAQATLVDYGIRAEKLPPAEMTFCQIEGSLQTRGLAALMAAGRPQSLLGSILSDAINPTKL